MTTKRLKLHLEQLLFEYFTNQKGKDAPYGMDLRYGKSGKLVTRDIPGIVGFDGLIEFWHPSGKKQVSLKFKQRK
jgi:hypothetical protein